MSLSNLKRPEDALTELGKINRRSSSAILRLRADSLAARLSKELGKPQSEAVKWNLFLLDDYSEIAGKLPPGIPPGELVSESDALSFVKLWVDNKDVTADEVKALPFKAMKGKRSGGYASYKYALVLHSSGDTKTAIRQLKSYVSTYPQHEYYGAANLLMGELGGVVGSGAGVTVGAVLPMSGRYAVYGESVLHGIECAAGVYEPCVGPAGMKVIVRDSGSTPEGAVKAVDELAELNVAVIIGPLISNNAADVAKRAQELGIPLISVSQKEGITDAGDYVFRNSLSDSSEISTLGKYAVTKLGMKRFYVVYPPGNKKAVEYKNLFVGTIKDLGGNIVAAQPFEPKQELVASDELRGRGAVEMQANEDQQEQGFRFKAGAEFDALFIPDSLQTAVYIASRLESNVAEKTRLLGIARWDDPDSASRAGPYAEGAIFTDSFFKDSSDEVVRSFVRNFKSAYGIDPTLLEALGFDSMRLIIGAVEGRGAVHRDSIRDALARTSNFHGVTGKLRFDEKRNVDRELAVLTIKGGTIVPAK